MCVIILQDDKRESGSRSRSCSLCEKQECETSTDKENPDPKWDEEDPKDNIEKEIKMKAYPYVLTVLKEGGATTNLCFPPVITHTAATPQGSPNATLTLQRPEKTLNVSNPSLDKNPTPVSLSPEVNGVYPVFQVASLNIPSIHLAAGGSPQNSRRSSVIVALSRQSSIISNISRKVLTRVDSCCFKSKFYRKDLIDELKIFGMSSRHHIDDFMRGRIIGKIEKGRKITDVAREFDIAHSVVSRLWKSFKTTGMCSRRHGGGRVRSTTPAEDRYIVLSAKRNSRTTAQQICHKLIWRESDTAYRPENIQEKDRYPTCSIMVWAGITINGRTRLHVVANGTMTGQRYIDEVLLPHVRLFRGAVGDKFVFMDDNATCHRTLAVQDCLDSEDIQRLVWPERSPDLHPIENVWDALGRQVAGRNYPPTNKKTLIRELTEEWDKLPQQLLDNVVQSMNSLGPCFSLQAKGNFNGWRAHKRKKSENESSENGSGSEDVVLNNMTSHSPSHPSNGDHGHCNGSIPTLQNTPNNKRPIANHNSNSPQNSIKSISLSQYREQQHAPCSRQMSLNSSLHSQNTLSPSNTYCRAASLSGASLKDDFKPNNLDEDKKEDTNQVAVTDCELPNKLCWFFEPKGWIKEREDYSLFLFSKSNCLRQICCRIAENKWFDYSILVFIASNCVTLAMERPTIPPDSYERLFLTGTNYIFIIVFTFEMIVKVMAKGLWYGRNAYFKSGWNIMDGFVVGISLVDVLLSFVAESSPKIFGILRVFRLLRSLRPLRVINRAPGLKLVVQTLLSSLRPIGNIVLICCTFFIIFGILGVQLFKGSMYYCEGPTASKVRNKFECQQDPRNVWQNRKYNFDNLGQALMSLFVLSSKDGWVNIMYTGLDAVGVDQQPIENYNEWRLLYFISFLLLVAFFVLNMFVGVVVENFHRCREQQELEEKARRAAKRAKKMDKKRRKMREPPYYINYSKPRLFIHNIITSKYFDLAIAAVIGLNVVTMAMEFYMMPKKLEYALKVFNYFFTAVFIVEAVMKVVALGLLKYLKNRWNQLDIVIVGLSIAGIVLEKMESDLIPINPTIIRVFRVLRIARVLKLLKMAKGIRALLDTVMQALPQVGNLGLLFFLLFFIFAALGVELFGRLECTEDLPCEGLGEHAHFKDFGMAFLTLFRVATGDNWNGIMKDTLRDNCDYSSECIRNCCVSPLIAPLYFVVFVLMAQFVLVNVVVAVLMKHLEESHKQMDDDIEMDAELERELAHEKKMAEDAAAAAADTGPKQRSKSVRSKNVTHKPLVKMASLPPNFVFPFNSIEEKSFRRASLNLQSSRNTTDCVFNRFSLDCGASSGLTAACPNINIRQASPDETDSKVSVANLSPVPPRSSLGSNLNVQDQQRDQLQDDWTCVFASLGTQPCQVQLLPTGRVPTECAQEEKEDEKTETSLCEGNTDCSIVSPARRKLASMRAGSPISSQSDRLHDHSVTTDSTSLDC
ncbi:voltage-dependent T-type calcium channel subunit alpha-1H [Trichonephila clavipes]|nr:voltage-dependent T-type calcium channel subunit alpha-1H [Trichonephila clavipes]